MKEICLVFQLTLLSLGIYPSAYGTSMMRQERPKVVQLIPPALDGTTMLLSEGIRCTRPFRDGMFEISVKTLTTRDDQNKTVVNCYGMGGAGWTTMPGDVEEAIQLFEKKNISKKTPIRVIGAGCLGLRAALELTERGYKVAGITAEELYDLPSWYAAGFYALVSIKTTPEEQPRLDKINTYSFQAYGDIAKGKCSYLTSDVAYLLPVYCSAETISGLEGLTANGSIPPAEEVTLNFGNGVIHKNFVKYTTYFMDTTKMMRQMRAEVHKRGIKITRAKVSSFDDCTETVIFNCAGLGAKELNKDDQMGPVRGHLIMLDESAGEEHMKYMIYTKVMQDGKEEYIYLFPKDVSVTTAEHPEGTPCRGALGGTFVPVDNRSPEELKKLDKTEFRRMLERGREFFHGVKYK